MSNRLDMEFIPLLRVRLRKNCPIVKQLKRKEKWKRKIY